MSIEDFYLATPRETVNIMQGRFKNLEEESKRFELQLQASWEQTRWQTMHLVNIHVERGKRLKLNDLISFPWEEPQQKKYITSNDLKQFLN